MAGQESGVFGSTPDEWNALGDAETRWREISVGSGGTDDSNNPQSTPDVLSGFVISGGRSASQDDSSGSFDGLTPAVDAHYYRGYWAGIQAAMYTPSTIPSPAPYPIPGYGQEASSIVGRIAAAIGVAMVSPAEAGPRAFSERFLPVGVSGDTGGFGGGFNPVPPEAIFASDSDSAAGGRGPVTRADIEAELTRADQSSVPGMGNNWLLRISREMAYEYDFFPYGGGPQGLGAAVRFVDINLNTATNSGLPLFPVYEQMFGEGTPPLYMGSQAVALSNNYGLPIFMWGPITPPEY